MAIEFRSADWDSYKMDYRDPHRPLESPQREVEIVDEALAALVGIGALPSKRYDLGKFLAHREAVADSFEIPWTAITPRMQRLLYALNAIHRPQNMLAAGIFCGMTFISNAGAAIGPGACYEARALVGIEIKPEEAKRAAANVRKLDLPGKAAIVAADAVKFCAQFGEAIHLLYLDADGDGGRGKGIYLDILEGCYDLLAPGALVLAHNSVNAQQRLQHYLAFARAGRHFRTSANMIIDGEGLEVSVR